MNFLNNRNLFGISKVETKFYFYLSQFFSTKMYIYNNDSQITNNDILLCFGLYLHHKQQKFYSMCFDKNIKIISYCHDLMPIYHCFNDLKIIQNMFFRYMNHLCMYSNHIFCNSYDTQKDLNKYMKEHNFSTTNSILKLGDDLNGFNIKKNIQQKYILYVSNECERKNHDLLFEIYSIIYDLDPNVLLPLYLIPYRGMNQKKIYQKYSKIQHLIFFFHTMNEEQLATLYHNAYFCVFPSLYEGYGLPVYEALALGQFVICSYNSALKEVDPSQKLIDYIYTNNVNDWVQKILYYIQNPDIVERKKKYIQKNYQKYTWKDATINLLQQLKEMNIL